MLWKSNIVVDPLCLKMDGNSRVYINLLTFLSLLVCFCWFSVLLPFKVNFPFRGDFWIFIVLGIEDRGGKAIISPHTDAGRYMNKWKLEVTSKWALESNLLHSVDWDSWWEPSRSSWGIECLYGAFANNSHWT